MCHTAGLRAHELHTLRYDKEVSPSLRAMHQDKFSRMPHENKMYTVTGKGGLIREVRLPTHLSERLEERRLNITMDVIDRGVDYTTHYDIAAGHKFSDAFSEASIRALGYTNGAHGLRHSYAQNRYERIASHLPIGRCNEGHLSRTRTL